MPSAAVEPTWQTDIAIAEAMACEKRFVVPLNMDFRCRIYGIPHFNFTREDHVVVSVR